MTNQTPAATNKEGGLDAWWVPPVLVCVNLGAMFLFMTMSTWTHPKTGMLWMGVFTAALIHNLRTYEAHLQKIGGSLLMDRPFDLSTRDSVGLTLVYTMGVAIAIVVVLIVLREWGI